MITYNSPANLRIRKVVGTVTQPTCWQKLRLEEALVELVRWTGETEKFMGTSVSCHCEVCTSARSRKKSLFLRFYLFSVGCGCIAFSLVAVLPSNSRCVRFLLGSEVHRIIVLPRRFLFYEIDFVPGPWRTAFLPRCCKVLWNNWQTSAKTSSKIWHEWCSPSQAAILRGYSSFFDFLSIMIWYDIIEARVTPWTTFSRDDFFCSGGWK